MSSENDPVESTDVSEPVDEFDDEIDDQSEDPTESASACSYTEYVDGEAPGEFPKTGDGATGVEADVWEVLYEIEDPEMPVSIVDLGLIYGVAVDEEAGHAEIMMTLTYTGCPARDYLKRDIHEAALGVDGVESVDLELVWSPPWNMDMVTDRGKDDLREFGLSV